MFKTFHPQTAACAVADFAETQVVGGTLDEGNDRFAPRSADEDWTPSCWATLRWVEEQEAQAMQTAQRLRAAMAAQVSHRALAAAADPARAIDRRSWLQRVEDTLDRLLPGNLASLLQLFICVSLSMALISAFLPLVDRI